MKPYKELLANAKKRKMRLITKIQFEVYYRLYCFLNELARQYYQKYWDILNAEEKNEQS